MNIGPKIPNFLEKVRRKARSGEFIILPHALERRLERDVSVVDIIHVLANGIHEKEKDQYKSEYRSWNYAIRGTTIV